MIARAGGRQEEIALFDRRAKFAFVLACFALVAGRIGFRMGADHLNIYLQKKPVELRDHFDNISTTLGSWQAVGEATKLTEEMVEELGTKWYLDRQYARNGDPRQGLVSLHIAYYTGMIDAVPHVPDRCFVAGGFNIRVNPINYPMTLRRVGWRKDPTHVNRATGQAYETAVYRNPITGRSTTVRMPVGDLALRTTEFSHTDMPRARVYGGYFFIANGRATATPEGVKLFAFKKSEEYAYYCKIQFIASGAKDFQAEQFVALSADLLEALLPELMRCLPDWAETEARLEPAPPESEK